VRKAHHLDGFRSLGRAVSLRRQRFELATLRLARTLGPLGIVPILGMLLMFSVAAQVPVIMAVAPVALLGVNPFDVDTWTAFPQIVAAVVFWVVPCTYGLVILVLGVPWLIHWYFIGFALMFGLQTMANRKEAALATAVEGRR
jgi:hypothetical protein